MISSTVRCEASKQISFDLKLEGYLVRHLCNIISYPYLENHSLVLASSTMNLAY